MESGKYRREIASIAIPVATQSFFNTLMHAVDSKIVSTLGITKIAAVSFTNTPRLLIFSLFYAFDTVATILVSEALGRKDRSNVLKTIKTGLITVSIFSILFGVFAGMFSEFVMSLFVKETDTLIQSAQYFRIIMAFSVFTLLSDFINSCNVANDNSRSVLMTGIASNILNVFFDYQLIDGHLGFPASGISGAAIATVLSQFCGLLISVYYLLNGKNHIRMIELAKTKAICRDSLKEYSVLWKGVATSKITERVNLFILAIIYAKAGVVNYSIYTIGNYYLNIDFAIGNGLSSACLALFSKNREDLSKMKCYVKALKGQLFFLSLTLMLIYPISGNVVYSWFSSDISFIRTGFYSTLFLSAIVPFHICSLVMKGILNSLKDTGYVSIVTVVSLLVVNCLVSYLCICRLNTGVYGIWIGCLASYIFSFVFFWIRTKKNRQIRSCF